MRYIEGKKYYASQIHVAEILHDKLVTKSVDFSIGRFLYDYDYDYDTNFSTSEYVSEIKKNPTQYKPHILEYIKQNPKVRKVVYSTNDRLLRKIYSVTRGYDGKRGLLKDKKGVNEYPVP